MAHQPLSEFDLEAAWKSAESNPAPKRPPKVPTPAPTPLVRDALRRQYAGIAFSIAITALYLYVLAVTPSWILRGGILVLVAFNVAVTLKMIPLVRRLRHDRRTSTVLQLRLRRKQR